MGKTRKVFLTHDFLMACAEGEGNREAARAARSSKRDREDDRDQLRHLRLQINEQATDQEILVKKIAFLEQHRPPNYIELVLKAEVEKSDTLRQEQAAEHRYYKREWGHLKHRVKLQDDQLWLERKKVTALEAEIALLRAGSESQCISEAPLE